MKLVFSSAIFASAVTSASATCAIRGNNAASIIMGENGCFPDPTNGALSSDDCNNPNRAAAICERFISINYDEWCYGGFPSLSSLQDQCWDRVQMLEVESGKQKECSAPSPVFPTRLCSPHLSFHTIQSGRTTKRRRIWMPRMLLSWLTPTCELAVLAVASTPPARPQPRRA